jgi:hypothetical protein
MRAADREKYVPTRSIRMGDRWERLGAEYGARGRSKLFEQVAAYLLREPGAKLPERAKPEHHDAA